MPDIQEPPMLAPSNDIDVQLAQAKFWCVLIALYTGMRLNEIAKLRPADFQVEHGIALINLTILPGRTFKTPQSARRVPLHRDLIDLGLPEFAAAVARTNHKSLLPSVVYSEVSYQCGANISKWFLRFRRAAGVSDPNTPFHSFRNTFITAMRSQCSGGDILVDQIVGHKPSGVNAGYTGIISLARKSAEINAIHYDVDLTSIKAAITAQRLTKQSDH